VGDAAVAQRPLVLTVQSLRVAAGSSAGVRVGPPAHVYRHDPSILDEQPVAPFASRELDHGLRLPERNRTLKTRA